MPVEVLGREPELDDEIAGQVFRLGLAPLLPPEAQQGGFIAAHDDPGVGAADELATKAVPSSPKMRSSLLPNWHGVGGQVGSGMIYTIKND